MDAPLRFDMRKKNFTNTFYCTNVSKYKNRKITKKKIQTTAALLFYFIIKFTLENAYWLEAGLNKIFNLIYNVPLKFDTIRSEVELFLLQFLIRMLVCEKFIKSYIFIQMKY